MLGLVVRDTERVWVGVVDYCGIWLFWVKIGVWWIRIRKGFGLEFANIVGIGFFGSIVGFCGEGFRVGFVKPYAGDTICTTKSKVYLCMSLYELLIRFRNEM